MNFLLQAAKTIALMALGLCVVGFGLCGAMGSIFGLMALLSDFKHIGNALWGLIPGMAGLAVAWGCWFALRALMRDPRDVDADPR